MLSFDNFCGRPKLTFSSPKRPSWKNCGAGTQEIEFIFELNGALSVDASEVSLGSKTTSKRVMISMDEESTEALRQFLNASAKRLEKIRSEKQG